MRLTPRFTAVVTSPLRKEWPPKVDGSNPRRAAPCFTIAATLRPARRCPVIRCAFLFTILVNIAPVVLCAASIHALRCLLGALFVAAAVYVYAVEPGSHDGQLLAALAAASAWLAG